MNNDKFVVLATKKKVVVDNEGKRHIVHRILRLQDLNIGGWVEREENLAQDGDCWIADDAVVIGDAKVMDDAIVSGEAMVMDMSTIAGKAEVSDYATIRNTAVLDNAKVGGYTNIVNSAVLGKATVTGLCSALSDSAICEDVNITGNAKVNTTILCGKTIRSGDVKFA